MTTFRIITIRDPRTPVFRWWEIEGHDTATDERWTVAVCDTKEEARDLIKAVRAESKA